MSGLTQRRLIQSITFMICSVLIVPAVSFAGSYRDKHGNPGMINLGAAVVNPGGAGIDYSVPYTLTDSVGSRTGEYVITSQMLPGRDPLSDDFVLNVFVTDDGTSSAAELSYSNNPNVAPLMPILRLLDCSTPPCTEAARYDDPKWGAWIIQDQSHLANYPIELLDARVILQLLDSAELDQLPNSTAGTGNWAEIMENHRSNFEETKFRMDTESLGATQSEFFTSRLIAEIDANRGSLDACTTDADCSGGEYCAFLSSITQDRCNSVDDWLVRHNDPAAGCGLTTQDPPCVGISHFALSFFTEHKTLIEAMSTALFENPILPSPLTEWPHDFSFPFGRIPVFLVDPNLDAGPDSSGPDDFHQIPQHWERVITGQGPLGQEGCWHDWPDNAYTPILDNGDGVADPGEGTTNLGQFECQTNTTGNGFVDRRCDVAPTDYDTGMGSTVEGGWHGSIHGEIGGSFGPADTTAGTMVFWAFHTYASTVALSNWRQAQKREMPEPISVIQVGLDIKPGSDPNCIQRRSRGTIPVAILGTADLDVNDIDPPTVFLEGVVPVVRSSTNKDVSGDGFFDFVGHFSTSELKDAGLLDTDGASLSVFGALLDGTPLGGSDTVFLAGGPNCFD